MVEKQSVALSVVGVCKRYPGVVALDNVDFDVDTGEVHALLGENGAGKSTLIKMISGYEKPDSGRIAIDGNDYHALTPREALRAGVGTIYQDASLVPGLSVAENIFLGDMPRGRVLVRRSQLREKAASLLEELEIDLDPKRLVTDLSVSQAQFVSIARAVARDVRVLIMDEPTAPLADSEVKKLHRLVRRLRERGVAIIYITHRLQEVYDIADRVTIMRDGRVIKTVSAGATSRDELVKLIVGKEIGQTYPPHQARAGEVVLAAKQVSGSSVRDISFDLHRGEILGVAGLMGSGRTELVHMLFGAEPIESGALELFGEAVDLESPERAVKQGIGFVPSDRKNQAVLLDQSIGTNISLPVIHSLSHFAMVNKHRESEMVEGFIDGLRIKTPSSTQLVRNLSGGNQQKVALSKWLARKSEVFILDEPTQGVDIGARQEIYRMVSDLTERGISVIMSSSDTEELMGMSDRIMVLHDGRVAGMLMRNEYDQEKIMAMASGIRKAAA